MVFPSDHWRKSVAKHLARGSFGTAAAEFAIVAPVLLSLFGAAMDLGSAIERSIRLANAARAGAQYATAAPSDTTGASSLASSLITDLTGSSVTVVATCACPSSTTTSTGNAVPCNSTCGSGMAQYITVTVTAPFTPIFPFSSMLPFETIGSTTGRVVARIS